MEKIDVMLVAADEKSLESVAKNLNTDAINLGGALTDIPKKKSFPVGKEKITAYPFLSIASVAANFKNFFWLVGGTNDTSELLKLQKFSVRHAERQKILVQKFPCRRICQPDETKIFFAHRIENRLCATRSE